MLFAKISLGNNNLNENKTRYFCSELIAYIYMNLNILDKKNMAKSYLPGTFSSDMKLEFLNGAELGSEYIIDF